MKLRTAPHRFGEVIVSDVDRDEIIRIAEQLGVKMPEAVARVTQAAINAQSQWRDVSVKKPIEIERRKIYKKPVLPEYSEDGVRYISQLHVTRKARNK
jgi:hypothetical protein